MKRLVELVVTAAMLTIPAAASAQTLTKERGQPSLRGISCSTSRFRATCAALSATRATPPPGARARPRRRRGARQALLSAYLHGFSCLHALMRNVWPMSPPSHPEKGQSLMILGFTTTSMCTSKSGMISKFSNL